MSQDATQRIDGSGTHQSTEDDGEDVDVHGGAGEAPEQERAQCAPEGADDHDGRVGEVVAKVAQKDLAYDGGGVEQRQDDCGRKLVGERPREGGDVERDREVRQPLEDVREGLQNGESSSSDTPPGTTRERMDTNEGHEEGVREEGHLSREELGPLLCGSVPGSGEPAADAEERDGGAHARSDRPYTQRPAQADLVKEVVDQEGEREAADARPREDDTPGEPTPPLKPFGDEPDDGDVEDTPADADSNALQEDELPDLCVA